MLRIISLYYCILKLHICMAFIIYHNSDSHFRMQRNSSVDNITRCKMYFIYRVWYSAPECSIFATILRHIVIPRASALGRPILGS